MAIYDYDEVNKKLYESGLGHSISSDPVEISRRYAEAGVDISHYSPLDLVRANDDYYNYSDRADEEKRYREYEREMREREEEYEREEEERRMRDAELEEEYEREEEERIRRIEAGEYVGDYDDYEKDYMRILTSYPEELYAYLHSKGAYPDEVNSEGKVISMRYKFPDSSICTYDQYKKKYHYGWVCDVEPRLKYDLQYFDFDEWENYIGQIEELRARVKEYEWLKSYEKKPVIINEVETLASHSFQSLYQRVESFKKTGIVNDNSDDMLNYKVARSLAFDNDPKSIVDRIGQVIRRVLK